MQRQTSSLPLRNCVMWAIAGTTRVKAAAKSGTAATHRIISREFFQISVIFSWVIVNRRWDTLTFGLHSITNKERC